MTEYSEVEIDPGEDVLQDACHGLARGKPWVFLVVRSDGDGVAMQINVGGGIANAAMLRRVLTLALDAIPEG
jgi:hypothetical protein